MTGVVQPQLRADARHAHVGHDDVRWRFRLRKEHRGQCIEGFTTIRRFGHFVSVGREHVQLAHGEQRLRVAQHNVHTKGRVRVWRGCRVPPITREREDVERATL